MVAYSAQNPALVTKKNSLSLLTTTCAYASIFLLLESNQLAQMPTKTATPIHPGSKVTESYLRSFVREVCELRHRATLGTAVYVLPLATRWGLHYRTKDSQRVACVHDCVLGRNVSPWRSLKSEGSDLYADLASAMDNIYLSTMQ